MKERRIFFKQRDLGDAKTYNWRARPAGVAANGAQEEDSPPSYARSPLGWTRELRGPGRVELVKKHDL